MLSNHISLWRSSDCCDNFPCDRKYTNYGILPTLSDWGHDQSNWISSYLLRLLFSCRSCDDGNKLKLINVVASHHLVLIWSLYQTRFCSFTWVLARLTHCNSDESNQFPLELQTDDYFLCYFFWLFFMPLCNMYTATIKFYNSRIRVSHLAYK